MKPKITLTVPERKALRLAVLCLALLGGAGLFFGYANPFAQIPALVLLLPAVLAVFSRIMPSAKGCFYAGWLTATIGNSACLYWLSVPMHDFGLIPWPLTAPIIMALGAYLGLYGGVFAWLYRRCREKLPFMTALLLAAPLWATTEIVKGWLFTGFPWVNLATSFLPWNDWVQAASVLGAEGLSGVFALAAVALAEARPVRAGFISMQLPKRKKLACYATAVLSMTAVYACSFIPALPEGRQISVGLIQGNVDQNQKWEPAYQLATLERYLTLSEWTVNPELGRIPSEKDKADLIVWPETAMPFYLESNPYLASKIIDFSNKFEVPVAFGAPGKPADAAVYGYHNRLWLQTPGPGALQAYDKTHLVPFGEYVPLNIPIPFVEYLMQGVSFIPGTNTAPLQTGDLALGSLICYEAIFPAIARERVAAGANILVNISNDAWFGNTSAPVQHLHLTAMRAIEQGRYVVRATNTGISAVITPKGRVAFHGSLFRAEALIGSARLVSGTTIFHAVSPFIIGFCLIASLAALLAVRGKKEPLAEE
ncbi:MAG: Apolipoprotein N-acyltransferase [Desulfovibrio sp.]